MNFSLLRGYISPPRPLGPGAMTGPESPVWHAQLCDCDNGP